MIESLIPGWEFREAIKHVRLMQETHWTVLFIRNTDARHIFARGETLRDALAEAATACAEADTALQCNT